MSRSTLIDPAAFKRAMENAARKAAHDGADTYVRLWCENVSRGNTPAGNGQKSIEDSTRKAKQRKGQPTTPLVATKRLTTVKAWRVTKDKDGASVSPPSDRADVLEHLDAAGFTVFETPAGFESALARILDREISLASEDPSILKTRIGS